jgi:hypothetical protein
VIWLVAFVSHSVDIVNIIMYYLPLRRRSSTAT